MTQDLSVLYNDINETYDFVTVNGDFAVVASTNQHLSDLLYSFTGDWKEYPNIGLNMIKYLNSQLTTSKINAIETEVTSAVIADGGKVKKISLDKNFNLDINIEY